MADPNLAKMDVEETEKAVNSIINKKEILSSNQNEEKKRPIGEVDKEEGENIMAQKGPMTKKPFIKRYYVEINKGPFEVIIQSKERKRLNPFFIGKILQSHHKEIKFIERSGNNLTVNCESYTAANNLVDSPHLKHLNVFVPSNKIHTVGVVMIEPELSEEDIINEIYCSGEIKIVNVSRIKRKVDNQLIDSNFVKVTFHSDKLPEFAYLNYVRLRVDTYRIPVKQCFRCFSYSHTANQPGLNNRGACEAKRICRDCSEEFHGPCDKPKKCFHCHGPHSSNSRTCPEFLRQRNIKDRMVDKKEDFFTAVKHFPITYKPTKQYGKTLKSYAQVSSTQIPNTSTLTSNRFLALSEDETPSSEEPTTPGSSSIWKKPKTPFSKYHYKNRTDNLPPQFKQRDKGPETVTSTKNSENQINREMLLPLLKAKLTELRNKIAKENFSTKKQVTDMFEAYINTVEIKNESNVDINKASGSNVEIKKGQSLNSKAYGQGTSGGSQSPNNSSPPLKQPEHKKNGK